MAVSAGSYYILSAYDTDYCLEVAYASAANGANIRVFDLNYSNAQMWDVTYRSDGSLRLTQHYSGKVAEVYGDELTQGANVQIFSNNDSNAQKWSLVDTGSDVTVDGVSYDAYFVYKKSNNQYQWVMECDGTQVSSGTNVDIARYTEAEKNERDRWWVFVPVKTFANEGVYEVHSVVDTRMVWDVPSGSRADGAGVLLYGRNAKNSQKWAFEEISSGVFAIRNINSNKYIGIKNGTAVTGTPLVQTSDATDSSTWFTPVTHADMTYNGVKCAVLGFNAYDNSGISIDVLGAVTTANAVIQVSNAHQQANQDFLLYPTDAVDPSMPVPYDLGIATKTPVSGPANGTTNSKTSREGWATVYPTWFCSQAWITDGANHYQIRWRTRLMSSQTSAYGAWSAWTAWKTANAYQQGSQAWFTDGVAVSYSFAAAKRLQLEFQVRTAGAGDDANVVSNAADKVCNVIKATTVSLTAASYSIDGLHVSFSSDYAFGTNKITLNSIYSAAKGEMLESPYMAVCPDNETTFVIPNDAFSQAWSDGETAVFSFQSGNDQVSVFGTKRTSTLVVAYDSNHGASAEPTLTLQDDRTILATVEHIGTERMWLVVDGVARELESFEFGADSAFIVPFPFGKSFELWTLVEEEDLSAWGTDFTSISADDPLVAVKPCHAWSWSDGATILEIRQTNDAETQHTLQAIGTTDALDSRKYQTVRFSATSQSTFVANGLLIEGITEESYQTFASKLYNARHVVYRSPAGDLADVAIMGIQMTKTRNRTQVVVTMTEETL